MEDSFVHIGLRNQLVDELQSKGITDNRVLTAMRKVPRHFFCFDEALAKHAYQDKAFPIESGQTISQPYTVAIQSQLLDIHKNEKVLEIGTGSGYQAAILFSMGAKVYTIERQKKLYIKTKQLLQDLGYQIHTFLGDGNKGLPSFAPFDKIIITAAAPLIPIEILKQLKIGGIIVAPVNNGTKQTMLRIKKLSETQFEQSQHGEFSFVPMLTGLGD